MPVLKNARHERFAQACAAGKTMDEAYKAAGFKPHNSNPHRLRHKKAVAARIAELQAEAAAHVKLTVDDIVKQLAEDRQLARMNDQAGAAVQATMGQAKVLGLIVDKQVQVTKAIKDMNKDELKAFLGRA